MCNFYSNQDTCAKCTYVVPSPCAGIVYCFSRKETEQVTLDLTQQGIKAGCYHGYLSASDRTRVHMQWLEDVIQVCLMHYYMHFYLYCQNLSISDCVSLSLPSVCYPVRVCARS